MLVDGSVYKRIVPVGLALSPIGFFFGILSSQEGWGALEVFWMSLIGFTGSGQFTYLGFANQGMEEVGYITAFLIILSLNLRYIPMSLSVTAPISCSFFKKAILSHFLADESYAVEKKNDDISQKLVIRMTIVFFWVLSTSAGVYFSDVIPLTVKEKISGMTFPISAILILLSFGNISSYVTEKLLERFILIFFCFFVSITFLWILGTKYFWIPSIFTIYMILIHFSRRENG